MTNFELCSLVGVETEGRASNFADGPIVSVTLNQETCRFDKPPSCRLAAITPLLAMVATTMTLPRNV